MNNSSARLTDTAMRTWISFLVITSGLLALLFLYNIRSVLLQLAIALILATALNPLVGMLTRRGIHRVIASVVTVFTTLLVLFGLLGAIASPLISQGSDLISSGPALIDKATANPVIRGADNQLHVIDKLKSAATEAPKTLLAGGGASILGVLGSVLSAISTTVVIFTLVLFMLMEGPTAWAQFIRLMGRHKGRRVNDVAGKIVAAVSGFVSGNLLISLIAGIVTLITLLVMKVPYAFALAALVAVFDLIPLVGATLATVVIAVVALSKGFVVALIVVGIMLTYQFAEGNLIQPIVYGRTVQLSQLLIVVASIIGALLGGIVGVLLAIPVAAAAQIIVIEILRSAGADLDPNVAKGVE